MAVIKTPVNRYEKSDEEVWYQLEALWLFTNKQALIFGNLDAVLTATRTIEKVMIIIVRGRIDRRG